MSDGIVGGQRDEGTREDVKKKKVGGRYGN